MRAITRNKYGTPEVLSVREIAKPVPGDRELLVRIHATTVNRTDCGILAGWPLLIRVFTGLIRPNSQVPGTDFAGKVVQVGSEVQSFKVGDRIWGLNDEGLSSQAEFMKIREGEAIALIPQGVTYQEAAACAEGGHYAYNFLHKVKIKKGDKVLVNGATGAIGSASLQMLKHLGAYVTAVGNTKNLELLRSLGADKVFNYETEDFTRVDEEKYHFIFDAVGKSNFGQCKKLMLPNATYISSELGPGAENLYLPLITKIRGGKRLIFPIPSDCKRSILFLNTLLEAGAHRAVIDRSYQMEDIQDAYHYVAKGQKTGSVIIDYGVEHTG